MPSRKAKAAVLVVDDDVRMLRMVKRMLELEGYQVRTADNGEDALGAFDKEAPNIVLLDIMMPDMDGYTVCRRIREFSQAPVIMVSAKTSDKEKVEGLDVGADDYVTKPFSASELAARVRAVLRRTSLKEESAQPTFCTGDLVIDFARHRVNIGGEEVRLTATEYRVLSYLASNAGRVVTPDQLLEQIWGEEYIGDSHLLQVSIARLRQKLKDEVKKPKYILTRPGIGYMMMK